MRPVSKKDRGVAQCDPSPDAHKDGLSVRNARHFNHHKGPSGPACTQSWPQPHPCCSPAQGLCGRREPRAEGQAGPGQLSPGPHGCSAVSKGSDTPRRSPRSGSPGAGAPDTRCSVLSGWGGHSTLRCASPPQLVTPRAPRPPPRWGVCPVHSWICALQPGAACLCVTSRSGHSQGWGGSACPSGGDAGGRGCGLLTR